MKWSQLVELVFEEALKSPLKKTKHGAVIYSSRDGVISSGHNRYLFDDQIIVDRKRSICAERSAIQKCGEPMRPKLKGAKLILLKLNWTNKIKYQDPCAGCQRLLDKFGLILIRITPDMPRIKIKHIPYNICLECDDDKVLKENN